MRKLGLCGIHPLTRRYVLRSNMRDRGIFLVAFALSIVQAYCAYLLHNDLIQIEILQWIVSVVYIPLYFALLLIGGLLESIFGLPLLKGGVAFPYLSDVLWIVGVVILLPFNLWFFKLIQHFKQRT
ncbi:TPA: hypothetical protein I7158_22065 [Vibrio vulnificus]|nr:hypothetical protein [Vibrio vulnificus]HAU8262296.1 hypothetical protein [Vibrio vulnificus]